MAGEPRRAPGRAVLTALLGLTLLPFAAAAPAAATTTIGPDGVARGAVPGDPASPGDLSAYVRPLDLPPFVRTLALNVESLTGDVGVSTQAQQTTVTVSADVLFAFDRADLTPAARAKLAEVADQLRSAKASGQVVVGGHADHLGNAAYNQALSLRRAQAVVAALQPMLTGVPVTLVAQGFGATRPRAKETKPDGSDDPAGRARNRRVTVTFDHPAA